MRLNFGKGEYGLPHFYYSSVAKWILQFHSDLLFNMAAEWLFIITVFATTTFLLASFTAVPYSIGTKQPPTKLGLWWGGGGGGISHLCQIFSFCYACERKNSCKMTQIEMTVNVKIVMMAHLWCVVVVFDTKTVATEYSYRLLQCCDPQFRLFDP